MKRDKQLFDIFNWLFWIILGIILFLVFPYFKNGFFDEKGIEKWTHAFEEQKIDTVLKPKKDSTTANQKQINIIWAWEDFKGINHRISFTIPEEDYKKAVRYRTGYKDDFDETKIYLDFISVSLPAIDSMTKAMKIDMEKNSISGYAMMDYVVTAIQNPVYTKITHLNECPTFDMGQNWLNDCREREDGRACCNNVIPFAVYTPTEFIVQKTGDCDTKALIAYAILKRLNFSAAILIGEAGSGNDAGGHAMLGVANVVPEIPTKYVTYRGTMYHPWEVTSFRPDAKLGNMRMWSVWRNWHVVCD
jgi:hypothetical protein